MPELPEAGLSFIVVILVVVFILIFKRKWRIGSIQRKQRVNGTKVYQYKRRQFFMSRAEHECFDALMVAAGHDYFVFAQVHLLSIVDEHVIGQNWMGARSHVNQKSVDFVLCDKRYISPKLAIELDDKTHERLDRQVRDKEVERILQIAGLPLLRLENHGRFDPADIGQKINAVLSAPKTEIT